MLVQIRSEAEYLRAKIGKKTVVQEDVPLGREPISECLLCDPAFWVRSLDDNFGGLINKG